ncbi:MAG: hypothetical protein A2103_01205 [Gammaproteobacteria bacterium GWF2_41_13]|nr:MAG: hypothetical protein A2103_01205 [Gammaproteobacteria bacterium GWF2_41_13]
MKNWKDFSRLCERHFYTKGSTYAHALSLQLSKIIIFIAYNLKFTPNGLTVLSTIVIAIGMGFIVAKPTSLWFAMLNILCLQLGFMLDCADGTLARLQNKNSLFGALLDPFLDRVNNFIVFIGFCVAWFFKSKGQISFSELLIYVFSASAYILYTVLSFMRGVIFKHLAGTMERFGRNGKEKLIKLPYQFMGMSMHFFILGVAYIFNAIFYAVLFYGILSSLMIIAMLFYLSQNEKAARMS